MWILAYALSAPVSLSDEKTIVSWESSDSKQELSLERKVWDRYEGPSRQRAAGHSFSLSYAVEEALSLSFDAVQWLDGNSNGQYLDLDISVMLTKDLSIGLDNRFAHSARAWGTTTVLAMTYQAGRWLQLKSALAFGDWFRDDQNTITFAQSVSVSYRKLKLELVFRRQLRASDLGLELQAAQTLGPVRFGFSASFSLQTRVQLLCTVALVKL